MSNFIHNVDYKRTGFSYDKYNSDIKLKGTFNDFVLPAWSIENFNQNETWKARYLLTYKETYEDLTEEQKEKLRREVFESWAQTIWSIIRQRFGLVLDTLGWEYLTNNVKQNLFLAIAYQINNWRVNLPYEINNNINRVSGNLQTTINASSFETGFDALGEQTKTALTATGLDTYNYEELLNKVYREDTLAIEFEEAKARLTALETRTAYEVPDNLITRVEASNLFERIGQGYITKTSADSLYVKQVEFQGLENGGYFQNENRVSDNKNVKTLKNTAGDRELKISKQFNNISYEIIKNGAVERSLILDNLGLKVDGTIIPSLSQVENRIGNIVDGRLSDYLKTENINLLYNTKTESDNLFSKKTDTYTKTESDNLFYTQEYINSNFYNKGEVDTKITAAQTSGQVDLSNYYNKNEAENVFYTQEDINENYYTKANSDLRLSTISANIVSKTSTSVQEMTGILTSPKVIIRTEPVKNSNNSARMEDIISEVKRLFNEAITEYDKIGKKEYSDVATYSQFHTLEGDDEEIIITIKNQQILVDVANLAADNILVYTNTTHRRNSNGDDIQNIQRIYLRKVVDKIDFTTQTTSTNLGPAGIGTVGTVITTIDKVVVRKDSVRELIKALQSVV